MGLMSSPLPCHSLVTPHHFNRWLRMLRALWRLMRNRPPQATRQPYRHVLIVLCLNIFLGSHTLAITASYRGHGSVYYTSYTRTRLAQ